MTNNQNVPAKAGENKPQQQPKMTAAQLIESQQMQFERALPQHMNSDRFMRICLTVVRKNPELAACDAVSLLGAFIQCAELGLEPNNSFGHCWLIPYNNKRKVNGKEVWVKEAQLIPGYRGYIELAKRTGTVKQFKAVAVYEKDKFVYEEGLHSKLQHKPSRDVDRGELTDVYAIVKTTNGGIDFEVMSRAQVEAIRDRAKRKNPVWNTDFDEMAKKTVIRRIAKRTQMSAEADRFANLDDNEGSQELHLVAAQGRNGYIPQTVVSEDATTVSDMLEEGRAEAQAQATEEASARWLELVDQKLQAGVSVAQIKSLVGEHPQEFARRGCDQINAGIEALMEFNPKPAAQAAGKPKPAPKAPQAAPENPAGADEAPMPKPYLAIEKFLNQKTTKPGVRDALENLRQCPLHEGDDALIVNAYRKAQKGDTSDLYSLLEARQVVDDEDQQG